jgi:MFS family permease
MAARDPKIYLGALLVAPIGIGIGAFNVFLPTFINAFGYDRLHSQLISIIPYACALVSMLFFAWLSDYTGRKAIFCVCGLGVCCIGFIIFLTVTDKVVLLVGACLVSCGSYPTLVIAIAWTMTLHGGYTKRATSMWATQVLLQGYSIIATQVYRNPPRFILGHSVSLGLFALGILAGTALFFLVSRQNKSREERRQAFERNGETDPDMEKSFEELGDFHPGWKYTT